MRHRLPWFLGLALALVLFGRAPVEAATLLSLELVPDGSTQPPGDRIDASVLLLPGEDEVTLEARAFARLEGQDRVVPVPSKEEGSRDAQGNLLIRSTLRREGESHSIE